MGPTAPTSSSPSRRNAIVKAACPRARTASPSRTNRHPRKSQRSLSKRWASRKASFSNKTRRTQQRSRRITSWRMRRNSSLSQLPGRAERRNGSRNRQQLLLNLLRKMKSNRTSGPHLCASSPLAVLYRTTVAVCAEVEDRGILYQKQEKINYLTDTSFVN